MNPSRRIWLYRAIALLGVAVAVLAVLLVEQHLNEPDDWANYYAVQNFARGRLTIDDATLRLQIDQAAAMGGELIQYVNIAPNEWALAKAPGYPFYLVPFFAVGAPRLGNIALLLGLVGITYLLLSRIKDEKTAAIGTLLLLFTPTLLAMTQRHYMDSLASLAFPALGGALYLYYLLHFRGPRPRAALVILLAAGLCLGYGVVVRYTNAVILLVFGLHFLLTRLRLWHTARPQVLGEAAMLGLGVLLPLLGLLGYHWAVFGSPFAYGYQYLAGAPGFAYDYLGQGRSWEILRDNLAYLWAAQLVAYPLLMLALPAFLIIAWEKLAPRLPFFKRQDRGEGWAELNQGIFWLLAGWLIAIFGLYAMYERTADSGMLGMPYVVMARYYLPALLPLVLVGALLLTRQHRRLILSVVTAAVVLGFIFFVQSAETKIEYQTRQFAPENTRVLLLGKGNHEA